MFPARTPSTERVQSVPPSPRQLIGLGASIVGFVVLGLVLGGLLDAEMHTSPVFIGVGLALGVIGAAGSLIMQFRKFMKD
ncbi:AtpZ/AtpI family protein [Antrihabitans cavernicola]|uniref:AtpZ/AtpI family protein n=1 Tax=Antrihabitans cavernicola TaxID=2495913 RepID=A0A5A7S2C2_9NOCA|nr:hypothetical protein FOY51_24225 [Spelaeibacter cavernicola]